MDPRVLFSQVRLGFIHMGNKMASRKAALHCKVFIFCFWNNSAFLRANVLWTRPFFMTTAQDKDTS